MASMDAMEAAVAKTGYKDGLRAGRAFVEAWGLGKNLMLDGILFEGIETNAPIVIQRLPWASLVTMEASRSRAILIACSIDPESIDSEVADDLIWVYIAAYDKASRKVILDDIKTRKGR